MKNIFPLLIMIFFCEFIYSQNKITTKTSQTLTITRGEKFDPKTITNLYHIESGKKISSEELSQIIREINGRFRVERLYNKYGEVEKQFYNPNRNIIKRNSLNKKLEIGELFPDFLITTFDGKKIELIDLKGKTIIIHFGLLHNNILINKKKLEEIDLLNKSSDIELLMFLEKDEFEILKTINLKSTTLKFISNARGFMGLWSIMKRPNTLIINEKGEYLGEFKLSEIKINELLK